MVSDSLSIHRRDGILSDALIASIVVAIGFSATVFDVSISIVAILNDAILSLRIVAMVFPATVLNFLRFHRRDSKAVLSHFLFIVAIMFSATIFPLYHRDAKAMLSTFSIHHR